jgi:uncharacterized protein (TIGR02246 family)
MMARIGLALCRPGLFKKFHLQGWMMNSIPSRVALAVLVFLTFSATAFRAQNASNRDADTAAIKQCVAGFADTWNSHDAHGVAMRYVEDGDFSSVKGEPSHGRKELEDHYNMIFSTFLKNAHTTDTVRSIRFLGADLASVDIDWLVMDPAAPGGVLRKGLLTWVVAKRNGEWKIVVYHEQSF